MEKIKKTGKQLKVKKYRVCLKTIDALYELPDAKIRFKWGKSKVSKNVKRKMRKIYNDLNLQETINQVSRDFFVYGTTAIKIR